MPRGSFKKRCKRNMASSRIHHIPCVKRPYQQINDETARSSASFQNVDRCQGLFRYYEKKLENYETDYAVLDGRLQEYKNAYLDYYQLQMQLSQRDEQITLLQQALSDLQIAFVNEEAKVNKIQMENSLLKTQEAECRKQVDYLMGFLARAVQKGHPEAGQQELQSCCSEFVKQIQLVKEQVELNAKISQQQKETFIKDRQIRIEEAKAAQKRDTHQIRTLTAKLKKTQDLLHSATDEHFRMQKTSLGREKELLRQKEMMFYNTGCVKPCDFPPTTTYLRIHKKECQQNTSFAKPNSSITKPKCNNNNIRISSCKHQEKPKDLVQNELARWKKKFESLESRRQLEINGFQNDIKLLRNQLNSIEKQLFRLYDNRNSVKDDAVLRVIHQTETRSKRISDSVQDIKRRIYTMENELKSI